MGGGAAAATSTDRETAGRRWASAVLVLVGGWALCALLASAEAGAAVATPLGVAFGFAAPVVAGAVARSWWWLLVGVGVPFALGGAAVATTTGQGALAAVVLPIAVVVVVLPLTVVGIAAGRFLHRRAASERRALS